MFKRMVLLARAPDLSGEQFRAHWAGAHADIIKRIIPFFPDADTVRYTQNRVADTLYEHSVGADPFEIDGIVELHLTATQPAAGAFTSGAADEMFADERRFLSRFTECVVESEGEDRDDGAGAKFILLASMLRGTRRENFEEAFRQALAPGSARAHQTCLNWTRATEMRDQLASEPMPPDLLVELWGESSRIRSRLPGVIPSLTRACDKLSIFRIDPLPIVGDWRTGTKKGRSR